MPPNKRILVVDDEPGLRLSLAANLELEGYEVSDADDGHRALELARANHFDLVISDIRMPGMNGLETFRSLKQILPDTPVMLMTAFAVEELIRHGVHEGIHAIVHKPFAMDRVIHIIERALLRQLILVVDDQKDEAGALVESLRSVGLRATAVHDGMSALAVLRDDPVDVCVLDLLMPRMNGVETLRRLHEIDPSIPVVAITGNSTTDMIQQVAQQGSYTCLRKPFQIGKLLEVIAQIRSGGVSP